MYVDKKSFPQQNSTTQLNYNSVCRIFIWNSIKANSPLLALKVQLYCCQQEQRWVIHLITFWIKSWSRHTLIWSNISKFLHFLFLKLITQNKNLPCMCFYVHTKLGSWELRTIYGNYCHVMQTRRKQSPHHSHHTLPDFASDDNYPQSHPAQP